MNLHTHHRPGRMLVVLALPLLTVALLFLALGLAQQPAYSQGLPSPEAVADSSLSGSICSRFDTLPDRPAHRQEG